MGIKKKGYSILGMSRCRVFTATVLLLLATTIPTVSPRRRRTLTSEITCPSTCICKSKALYCDRARLTWIPRHLPRDLTVLRLRDNRIRKLGRPAFRGMIDLRHLSLTRNKITHIDPLAFSDLYNLLTVSLSDNELTLLSEDTFRHQIYLKDLSLSRNRLANVELILLRLENVQRLNLAENRLSRITESTFEGNAAIRVLYLQNNRISYIDRRAFKNLKHLVYLSVKDNPIVQVDIYLWANHHLEQLDATSCGLREVIRDTPPHLRDLRLAANQIEYIDDQSFEHIDQVHLLMLDDNLLQVIPNKALSKLTSLSDLHLTRNKLIELPQHLPNDLRALYAGENHIVRIANGTLNQLYRLRDLVLSYNRIHEIDEDSFRGLIHLVSLDLSNNQLRRLATNTFTDNRSLQRLDLSNNPLYVLEAKCFLGLQSLHILQVSNIASTPGRTGEHVASSGAIFRDLKSLMFLDLSNSSALVGALVAKPRTIRRVQTLQDLNLMNSGLTTLPSTLRVYLPYLRAVRLTGNPWHCDSRLTWLSRWMASGVVQFYEPERMLCDSPPSFRGRRIMDLSPAELRRIQPADLAPGGGDQNPTENPVSIQFKRVRPQYGLAIDPTDISLREGSSGTSSNTSSNTSSTAGSATSDTSSTAGSATSNTSSTAGSATSNTSSTAGSVTSNTSSSMIISRSTINLVSNETSNMSRNGENERSNTGAGEYVNEYNSNLTLLNIYQQSNAISGQSEQENDLILHTEIALQSEIQTSEELLQLEKFSNDSVRLENKNSNNGSMQTLKSKLLNESYESFPQYRDSKAISQSQNNDNPSDNELITTKRDNIFISPDNGAITKSHLNSDQHQPKGQLGVTGDSGSGWIGLSPERVSTDESSDDDDYSLF